MSAGLLPDLLGERNADERRKQAQQHANRTGGHLGIAVSRERIGRCSAA